MFLIICFIPFVLAAEYSVVIEEKSSTNRIIYQFPQSYELLNNFQTSFNLTNNNKDLILTKFIDRDYWCSQNICSCDICSFLLDLYSNDNKFSTINITITDINDHSCQFLDIQSNISLSESIQINHRFPIARAIDYDSGYNGQLSFKLLNHNNIFRLDIINLSANEYAIYGVVKYSLDRELNEIYDLTIEAEDHGLTQVNVNRTKVRILIVDENDNAPKFNQTEYSIQSLNEDTPIGEHLLTISATDIDKDLNGLIHYSIIISSDLSLFPFSIDSATGLVTLRSALDYEKVRAYRFLIRASDSGLPQSLYTDTWLSITIRDVNDCPVDIYFQSNNRFQYQNQTLLIHENIEINTLTLGYIRLSDRDSIQTKLSLTFNILNELVQQEYELVPSNKINFYTFIVKKGIFDREAQSNIKIRFIANDTKHTSFYDLNINLIDLNDNPSEFSSNPLMYYVEELSNYRMNNDIFNENYQLTIGYLNAVDKDEGENALNKYELLESNKYVKIDSSTGRLYLIQPLDREQITNIILKAKATNIVEPKWETEVEVRIQVLDVNDNIPQCLTAYQRISIPENYSLENPLIKIDAIDTDYDINGTINYTLETNVTWPFEINSQTGEIYSRKTFDYESEYKSFVLIINLNDQGYPNRNENKNACQIEINIEDINDNYPKLIDENQRKIFIDRNNLLENEIIRLNVTDYDSHNNGKIKYMLLNNEYSSLFTIHQNGSLHLKQKLNDISLFHLTVLLEDYGLPPKQTVLDLLIAVGDSSIPSYSTFDKIQLKYTRTTNIGLIIGLTTLIITLILFLCLILVCILLRQHRRRHQAAILARNKLLCSSSQQLTSSGSTTTTNTATSNNEQQQQQQQISTIAQSTHWNERNYDEHSYTVDTSSPESRTYKILHIPQDNEYYIRHYQQEKLHNHESDHGYHGSYETDSSSSIPLSQTSIHCSYMVEQLPNFITKCRTVSQGFLVEMNVDGSDEDAR